MIKRGKSILVKLKCFEDFKRNYAEASWHGYTVR